MRAAAVRVALLFCIVSSAQSTHQSQGPAPVRFCPEAEDGTCRNVVLPTYRVRNESDQVVRRVLLETCACHENDPAVCFPWRHVMFHNKSVSAGALVCDQAYNATTLEYMWEEYLHGGDKKLDFLTHDAFVEAAHVTRAEMQALFMQSVMYMDTLTPGDQQTWHPEFGIPFMLGDNLTVLAPLPSTYQPVLEQISSAVGALRDMPALYKSKLRADPGNTGPNAHDHLLQQCPQCTGLFATTEWFMIFRGSSAGAGQMHPRLPFCSEGHTTSPVEWLSNNIESFTTDQATAVKYAVDEEGNGSLLVVFGYSQGPEPFSGEYEFLLLPGARVKQLECEAVPAQSPTGQNGTLYITYGVEQTGDPQVDLWLTPAKEQQLLAQMKSQIHIHSHA